jgi:hypothetical protein
VAGKELTLNDEEMTLATCGKTVPYNRVCYEDNSFSVHRNQAIFYTHC